MMIAGCSGVGGENDTSTSGSSSTGSGSTKDLSKIGQTPDLTWHNDYMTGSHANYSCGITCHPTDTALTKTSARTSGQTKPGMALTSTRSEICSQCHMSNYNAASNFKHSQNNVGTYCNSCHYSDSFTSHSRVSHTEFHSVITTNCESCHSNRYPSSHSSSGRTSGCASCHQYSSGSWGLSSGGAHTYTSGCSSCHSPTTNHSGRSSSCETCHTYPTWTVAHTYTSGCSSCHSPTTDHSGRSSSCETCHTYPTWAWSHPDVTSGCSSCHSGHYSPYSCEGCHTRGLSWDFSHNSVSSSNCIACHADGYGDDGGEGGHGGGDN
ncbi:MAG: hypothetical protein HZB29_03645 [Nitrospinae bacterium]|nr:hypothetical protein [Nitrospinota bacterium]